MFDAKLRTNFCFLVSLTLSSMVTHLSDAECCFGAAEFNTVLQASDDHAFVNFFSNTAENDLATLEKE